MSSSLLSGVTGLEAHQQLLDVVGNNLANLNTTGFKAQQVNFQDLLYQTINPGTSSSSGAGGGTDPIQIGLGVKTGDITTDQTQGTLQATGGEFDMALQGNGYFVVNNGTQNLYTRAGAFSVNDQGYLVDPATGDRVQRFGTVGEGSALSPSFQTSGDMDVKIPLGTSIPGNATSSVTLQGNLSASAAGPLQETLTSSAPFTAGGIPVTSANEGTITLNQLDGSNGKYATGDTIDITGTNVDGSAVNTPFSVSGTTTVAQLLTAIDGAFPGATASLDSSGNLVLQANNPGTAPLSLTLVDGSKNAGTMGWAGHQMAVTTTGAEGTMVNSSIQVYDTQGNAHTLSVVFQKQSDNTWSLSASIPPADGTMISSTVQGITFNDNGSFQQVTSTGASTANISFQIAGLAKPQTVAVSFGTANQFDGLTQYGGATSAAATAQNGYAAGSLTSVSVGQDGTVNGVFSNGQTLSIAQLAVASFTNPDGLNRQGDNYYSVSNQSGLAEVGSATTGNRGSVQQGSLESSNVDVALEFTQMIIAQRGYEVNARTITVSDQILQDLTNIIPPQ